MKNNVKVALDVDGILANFYLAICKKFNKKYETVHKFYVDWLDFSKVVNNFDFWKKLPVLNPPESITFDIECYMTSLPRGMKEARKKWLKKNGFPDKEVIISHEKHKICKKLGIDLLIDDKPETIQKCKENGVFAIQYIPYYTKMPSMTSASIKHLPEAQKYIDLISLYKSVEDILPIPVKVQIVKEFHNSNFKHFQSLLNFIIELFSEEDFSNREALTMNKHYSHIMTKSILGEDVHNTFIKAVKSVEKLYNN